MKFTYIKISSISHKSSTHDHLNIFHKIKNSGYKETKEFPVLNKNQSEYEHVLLFLHI